MPRAEQRKLKLGQFPSGGAFNKALLFAVLGAAFIVGSFFLPDLGRDTYRKAVIGRIASFEIQNDIHRGLFTATANAGDTTPDNAATFMGIATQVREGIQSLGGEIAAAHVQELENNKFNETTEVIYQGIVQLKGLGLLNLDDARSNQLREKYYGIILSLTERHSAFRANSLQSASVSATYHAFEAIRELGKMSTFKKSEEFDSALQFVSSMKDPDTGGFRNGPGLPPTILATFHALQILAEKANLDSATFEGTSGFVLSCQAKDGGFANSVVRDSLSVFVISSCATTSQAIYILEDLRERSLFGSFEAYSQYNAATNYLHSCLTLMNGATSNFPSLQPDMESTYYFSQLVSRFPSVSYGTPPALRWGATSVGALLLLGAIHAFYSPQIAPKADASYKQLFRSTLFYLSLGALASQWYPAAAVFVYLFLVIKLSLYYFDVASNDRSGWVCAVAAANSAFFILFCFIAIVRIPTVFNEPLIFIILLKGLTCLCTYAAVLFSVYAGVGEKSLKFQVDAAVLAWITNTVAFFSMLYGSGVLDFCGRLLAVHGYYYAVLVALPLGSYFAMIASAAVAHSLTSGSSKKKGRSSSTKAVAGSSSVPAIEDASD